MDSLDCRSPARCATCEHSLGAGGCALERQLAILLAPRRAPIIHAQPARSVAAIA